MSADVTVDDPKKREKRRSKFAFLQQLAHEKMERDGSGRCTFRVGDLVVTATTDNPEHQVASGALGWLYDLSHQPILDVPPVTVWDAEGMPHACGRCTHFGSWADPGATSGACGLEVDGPERYSSGGCAVPNGFQLVSDEQAQCYEVITPAEVKAMGAPVAIPVTAPVQQPRRPRKGAAA